MTMSGSTSSRRSRAESPSLTVTTSNPSSLRICSPIRCACGLSSASRIRVICPGTAVAQAEPAAPGASAGGGGCRRVLRCLGCLSRRLLLLLGSLLRYLQGLLPIFLAQRMVRGKRLLRGHQTSISRLRGVRGGRRRIGRCGIRFRRGGGRCGARVRACYRVLSYRC